MATKTVTELITKTLFTATASGSSTSRATPQGGILDGANPSHYDPKNPIITFIIQAGIIIIFCRLLHWPLSKLRQPRVIAEVIGGILLGPSVMGRIPGFTNAIFPAAAMPNLTLIANLGLVLFLFLVGLEVDLRFLVSNWKVALSVGFAGMALPFGLGCALAWGLYSEFRNDPGTVPIGFGVYMLFIGVAMAITAFPVLCRILTELKLLNTPVGIIVLSAGVGNDVIGWILLALCVALVNAGTGLTALWVLLTCVAYTLFLVFAVRPGLLWVLIRTRSLQDGPSQSVVALTLLIALTSAFFTGVIGVHPIFGAFMAGLICPHEGGFAIKITEKIEDLVSTLFLPLYFALSGLSTNLGLLDNGITWAYVVGVIAVAFLAKILGGSGAARLNGLVWRECWTIGALMSCKGLVELIVLNIGLQAKILSTRTFTIFVVMALITTFATTPLTAALYPGWYQKKLAAWKAGEIDWDTGRPLNEPDNDGTTDIVSVEKFEAAQVQRLLIYLRLDSMPGLLALIALFGGANEASTLAHKQDQSGTSSKTSSTLISPKLSSTRPIEVHGVRLLQLTERDSSVMQVSEASEYSTYDPVVNTVLAFGRLHSVTVSGEVAIVPEVYYADTLVSRAAETSSDLLLLPWSETGSMSEAQMLSEEVVTRKLDSGPYNDFVKAVVRDAECNTAIFINNGFGGTVNHVGPRQLSRTFTGISIRSQRDRAIANPVTTSQGHHVFLPYFGGADDRVATRFVLQLAQDPRVTATIVHFKVSSVEHLNDLELTESLTAATTRRQRTKNTMSPRSVTETIPPDERHAAFLASIHSSLPLEIGGRVTVETVSVEEHLGDVVVEHARREIGQPRNNMGDLVVVARNCGKGEGRCLGGIGDLLVRSGVAASLLVVQAGRK